MMWFYIVVLLVAFHLGAYAADWQPPLVVNILVGVAAYFFADLLDRTRRNNG